MHAGHSSALRHTKGGLAAMHETDICPSGYRARLTVCSAVALYPIRYNDAHAFDPARGNIMTGYPELELYIDGRWKRADGQAVLNPADETVLGTVPSATIADLDDAIAAAERGFRVWRKTSPAKRAQIILKAASLIRDRVNEMAIAMTLEQGKPIEQARLEILRGCDIIEWDATEGLRMYGRVIPSEDGMRHTVLRQPIGPVAAFSPWNFPMSSPGRKVAGALSSGCSIILKASEETPAGAVQLVQAFHDAGLPPGVLNLVFGNPAEISGHLIPQAS